MRYVSHTVAMELRRDGVEFGHTLSHYKVTEVDDMVGGGYNVIPSADELGVHGVNVGKWAGTVSDDIDVIIVRV